MSLGFLAGGDDNDGEGKLAMPDILASLTKEQRKELAALRVDEKKWKKGDRRKKRKKKRKHADTDESSDVDSVTKEKQQHRSHKHRSHKSKSRGHRRKHHSSSTGTSSESDRAGNTSEPRDFSSRKSVVEGSEDDRRAAGHERHHRHRHKSSRSKGGEVHAKDRDHHDREKQKARDTVLDDVHESFKRQRRKEHRTYRHEDLPTG